VYRWLAALLVLLALSARAEELPAIHLKVVGGLGETVQFKQFEEPFWSKEVPAQSGGRITAEVTPWDQLGLTGADLLEFIRLGSVTIGNVTLAQMQSRDAEIGAVDLAGLNPDQQTLRRTLHAFAPTLSEILRARYGVHLLAVWTYPAQVIFCDRPISGLADLRGLNVRVSSGINASFVAGLGSTGVAIPYANIVDALKKHVVDCAITGAVSGYTLGLQAITTHLYPIAVSWGANIVIANQAAWQRLDPAVQDFLQRQLDGLSDRIWAAADNDAAVGIACLTGAGACPLGSSGRMTLVKVTDDDHDLAHRIFEKNVLPAWADRCGADCVDRWNRTVGQLYGIVAPMRR
jgi:TRAP-type C4-dicarboxylate transport system substrate-binding protein